MTKLREGWLYPCTNYNILAEHFTTSKPRYPLNDEFYVVQKRRSTDFGSLDFRNLLSECQSPLIWQKDLPSACMVYWLTCNGYARLMLLLLLPTHLFALIETIKSADQIFWTTKSSSIDWFWGSAVAKCSVRLLQLSIYRFRRKWHHHYPSIVSFDEWPVDLCRGGLINGKLQASSLL